MAQYLANSAFSIPFGLKADEKDPDLRDPKGSGCERGDSFRSNYSPSIPYAPDCCLCNKPVRVASREVWDGYEVTFDCHGRREVLFVKRYSLVMGGLSLDEYISSLAPFVGDFIRLNTTDEPPKQNPKPRTGLTIGQERVINLE